MNEPAGTAANAVTTASSANAKGVQRFYPTRSIRFRPPETVTISGMKLIKQGTSTSVIVKDYSAG
jgi:hypothetical protein